MAIFITEEHSCLWENCLFATVAIVGCYSPWRPCADSLRRCLGSCGNSLCHIDLYWMECHNHPPQLSTFLLIPQQGSRGDMEGQKEM